MPSPAASSAPLSALLRAIVFVGVIESLLYRLLPDPATRRAAGAFEAAHHSLSRAGGMAFFIAFFLVIVALAGVAFRTLRGRVWPAGLNGFIAACLLCVAALGFTTLTAETGPLFAITFTILTLVTLVFVAMDAFAARRPAAERAFAVLYCGAIACGTASVVLRFAARVVAGGDAGPWLPSVRSLIDGSGVALSAGYLLIASAAAAGFLSYCPWGNAGPAARRRFLAAAIPGGAAALAFAAACLIGPPSLSPIGPRSGTVVTILLSWALFLGALTALVNLFDPIRRSLGYGLTLILIAGFPPRIAYQDMLMLLGAVLVLGPRLPRTAAPAPGEVPLPPRPSDAVAGGSGPGLVAP